MGIGMSYPLPIQPIIIPSKKINEFDLWNVGGPMVVIVVVMIVMVKMGWFGGEHDVGGGCFLVTAIEVLVFLL